MAQLILNLRNITFTAQNGTSIEPTTEDALIVYSSTNATTWTKFDDSYNSTNVDFNNPLPPPLGSAGDRDCYVTNFPDDSYVKLKIVPGGCPAGDCTDIVDNNEDYDLYLDGSVFSWTLMGTMLSDEDSVTGNDLGVIDPADYRETVIAGCMNEFAENYDPDANVDDGCIFPDWENTLFLIDEIHYNPSTSGQMNYYQTGMNDSDAFGQFFELYIKVPDNSPPVNLRGCSIGFQMDGDSYNGQMETVWQFGTPLDQDLEHYSNGGTFATSNLHDYTNFVYEGSGGDQINNNVGLTAPHDFYVNGEQRIVFIHAQTYYTADWLEQFLTRNYSTWSSSEIQLTYSNNGLVPGTNLLPAAPKSDGYGFPGDNDDGYLFILSKEWGRFMLFDPFGEVIQYLGHYVDGRRPYEWEYISSDTDVLCDPWPNVSDLVPSNPDNDGGYGNTCNPEDILEYGYSNSSPQLNTETTKHKIGGSIQLKGPVDGWQFPDVLQPDNWESSKGVGDPGIENPPDYIRKVIISEIYFDNPNATEFFELRNLTNETIDISDWRVRQHNPDGSTDLRISYNFPMGAQIPANGYVVVARDGTNSKFDSLTEGVNLFSWEFNSLSLTGESINIYDSDYALVDTVDYSYMYQNLTPSGCSVAPCSESQWDNYGIEIKPDIDFTVTDNSGLNGTWDNWQVGLRLGGTPGELGDIPFNGCTDPGACNYNVAANSDDGSCEYTTNCSLGCGGTYCPATETENDTCYSPVDCSDLGGFYADCPGEYCTNGYGGGQSSCNQNIGCGCNNLMPQPCNFGSTCDPESYCSSVADGAIWGDIYSCEQFYDVTCGCGGSSPLNCNDLYPAIECGGEGSCPSTYCGNGEGPGGSQICCQLDDCGFCGGPGSQSGSYVTCCDASMACMQENDDSGYSYCLVQLDDCGVCDGTNQDFYDSCWDNGSSGTDPSNCGISGEESCCCGTLAPGECVAAGPLPYWFDLDGDGFGSGNEVWSCSDITSQGYVLNDADSAGNPYCNPNVLDELVSGTYGVDDCGICHYNSSGEDMLAPAGNFMYFYQFNQYYETSRDCLNECPNDITFFQEPYNQLCSNESDTPNEFGCDMCNICHGDNQSCSGCMDEFSEYVLNYDPDATIDCRYKIDETTGDLYEFQYSCCEYSQDCAGNPFNLEDGSENPDYGAELDDCGICEGGNDNMDCAGVCFGNNLIDDCGVCSCPQNILDEIQEGDCGENTHPFNFDQDCAGYCEGDNILDEGGCCLPLERDCAGYCDGDAVEDINGDCCPSIDEIDSCEVCNGGNELLDCAGTCSNSQNYQISSEDDLGFCCFTDIQYTYYLDEDGDGMGSGDSITLCSNNDEVIDGTYVDNNDDPDDTCSTEEGDGSGVVDQCGVCGGGNEDLDCNGVCFGSAEFDECGVCNGDSSSCADCAGTPNGDAVIDDCNICDGNNADQDCNGDCFGSAFIDSCGNCVGGNTGQYENWEQDCNGNCPDWGGDYFGPYNGGLDCAGECGGNHAYDLCGVCIDYDNDSESANTSCLGCPDETACNGPIQDNPNATTCNFDDPDNISVECCRWLDCNGECTCLNSDGTGGTYCVTTDECGVCNGDGECGGCDKDTALNYDIRRDDPNFEGVADLSCTFGDVVIVPQSTDGMAVDQYLIRVAGDDLRETSNVGGSTFNFNKYGWDSEFFQTNRTDGNLFEIARYNLRIKKLVTMGQSEETDTVLNNDYFNLELDAFGQDETVGLRMITDPSTYNTGQESSFWTVENGDGEYEITITAYFCNLNANDALNGANCNGYSDENSYPMGTIVSVTKVVNVINTQPIIQTIDSSYDSRKGIDFRQAELDAGVNLGRICEADSYAQNKYTIEALNSDKRQMLGMYYFDDNQCVSYTDTSYLSDEEKETCNLYLKSKIENKLDAVSLPIIENPTDIQEKFCFSTCPFDKNWSIIRNVLNAPDEYQIDIDSEAYSRWPQSLDGEKLCEIWNTKGNYRWCPNWYNIDFYQGYNDRVSIDVQVLSEQSVYGSRNSYPYEYYDVNCKDLRNYCCDSRFEGYHECVPNEFCESGYSLYSGIPCEEIDLVDDTYCEEGTFVKLPCADDYIKYLEIAAPLELSFYFYPRDYGCIFATRDIQTGSQFDNYYYITNINWGDDTPEDTNNPLIKLGKNKTIKHSYDRPGFYKITGDLLKIQYDYDNWEVLNFSLLNNFLSDYGYETDCFSTTGECVNYAVHPETATTLTRFAQHFELNILINDNGEVVLGESSPFIDYNSTVPVVGGVSKNSIYYKTLSRELGYFEGMEKPISLQFKNTHDKFNSQYALAKMDENKIGPEISAYTGSIYDESRTSQLPAATEFRDLLFTGQYTDKYEELGSYLGDTDIGQVRLLQNGSITMAQMLGFVSYDLDNSFVLKEGTGAVMFTAPHGQIGLRPTVSVGVDHDYDTYTSAIAEELHNITGAHVLYAVYQQDDPNYYDYIGVDFQDREAETETPAFVGMEGELIPFKRMLRNYLNEHPEIKLVIDIHGAGDYRPHILDIGTAGPFSRDPDGEYVEHDECQDGALEPCSKRVWEGSLDLEYSLDDIKNNPSLYAPTLHTDLGLGIQSDDNVDGDFLLQKIIDFMDNNQIGSGEYGYHDNFDLYEQYESGDDFKQNPPINSYTKQEGEWLDVENNHDCPDTLTDADGIPIMNLDGTEFCDTPGIKKPVTWNRDFTAGRAYTVTRFVGIGAMKKDNYYSLDIEPAPFVGKIDALQFEWNWNVRNFNFDSSNNDVDVTDTPTDLRSIKSMVEIHNYVNDYYGHVESIDDTTDWTMDYVSWIQTYTEYAQDIKNNINSAWTYHKSIGSVPFDYNVATELDNADNPGSKRYWKNIIPKDYSILDREGLNLNLQPNGNFTDNNLIGWKFEIQGLKPQNSSLRKQIRQQQNINHLNINWDVPLTTNLQTESATLVMQSDYNNSVYWEKPGTYIYTAEIRLNNDSVPFYINAANVPNDTAAVQWSSLGLETGLWHNVYLETDLIDPYYDYPMKGIFELKSDEILYTNYPNSFVLDFDIRNIQVDFSESTDEGIEKYFDEYGDSVISIDVNSPQRWKPYISGYNYLESAIDDTDEFIGEEITEPYYPVLPRFNVFGTFTDLYPYSNKDDNWFLQYTPLEDETDEEEEGDINEIDLVPLELSELPGSLHVPYGSPDRLWNEDDTNAPVTNVDFSNNAYRYHNYLSIDLDLSTVDDDKVNDVGGLGNEGLTNLDYKVKFDKDTRQPGKITPKAKLLTDEKDNPF